MIQKNKEDSDKLIAVAIEKGFGELHDKFAKMHLGPEALREYLQDVSRNAKQLGTTIDVEGEEDRQKAREKAATKVKEQDATALPEEMHAHQAH